MPARFTEQFTRSVPIHSAVLTKYSHEDIPILVENQKRRILKSPFFFRDETVIRAIINSILFSLLFIYFFLEQIPVFRNYPCLIFLCKDSLR